jgi:hypothetical protein
MAGLLLFTVVAIWLAVAISLARRISSVIRLNPIPRWIGTSCFGLVLFLLPVADELAAKPSFYQLCRSAAVLKIKAEKIKGRSMLLTIHPSHERISGTIVPVFHSHYAYRDRQSGEVLAEYELYSGQGGVLARWIGFARSQPLTGSLFCAPEERVAMEAQYDFIVLN